jgi:ribosomal subunit interface protein
MRAHVWQHVARLPRFDDGILYANVTMNMESGSQRCEIIVKCYKADLVAEATSHDMYKSIDEAFAKIARRISRHHDKLVNNRSRAAQKASEEGKRPA